MNTFVPVATVTVEKAVHGDTDARTGPVDITLSCDNGSTTTLHAPPGSDGPFQLAEPLILRTFPAQCTATETANGAGSGATVKTTHVTTTDGTAGADTAGTKVTVQPNPGQNLVLRFDDTYTAPTPPTSAPTTPPSSRPSTGEPSTPASSTPEPASSSAARLAQTGRNTASLLSIAGALVITGAALLILAARRRTRRGH